MLVVIAQKEELKLVEELGYENSKILITGVGGFNVIEALKDIPKDTKIINIGYVGSNEFPIGTIVSVRKSYTYHPTVVFGEKGCVLKSTGWFGCNCYTSTDFVTQTPIKEPCVFDMELAFICALGFRNIVSIKKVSDNLNKEEYEKSVLGEK